jgi:hypothetical protein
MQRPDDDLLTPRFPLGVPGDDQFGPYKNFIANFHASEASLTDQNGTPHRQLPTEIGGTTEKQRIASRLQGFNPKDNRAWTYLTQQFGPSLKQNILVQIATLLAGEAHVKLDRDAMRRKSVLVKWFEENWAAVSPFLPYIRLEE